MTTHGIERFLEVRPFKPFTLRESSGATHRIVSLESIRVMVKLKLLVIYPPDGSLVMLDPSQVMAALYAPEKPAKTKGTS
jgi:hypothetical protein